MKPNFALSLSFEGIGLLHRAFPGWHLVGDVPLDSDDLAAGLRALCAKAQALDPAGLKTKLVLPREQIKYLQIDAPAGADIADVVRTALVGATPYAVDDLAYDFVVEGGRIHIAAVARETLAEAEEFAVEHAFNPVSFVAMPVNGEFAGEPFFGVTAHMAAQGIGADRVKRDMAPIRVFGAAKLPATEDGSGVGSLEDTDTQPAPVDTAVPGVRGVAERAIQPETEPTAETVPETKLETASETLPETPPENTAEAALRSDAAIQEQENPVTLAAFSTIRASRDGAEGVIAPRRLDGASRESIPPRITLRPVPESGVSDTPPAITGISDAALPLENIPPATIRPRPAERLAITPAPVALEANPAPAEITAETAASARTRALAETASFFTRRKLTGPKPALAGPAPSSEDERQRMTIFGAREAGAVRGKPRFLGLILTAVLLLFMIGIAAWASIFMDEGLARFFRGSDAPAIATLPAPDTAVIAVPEEEEADTTIELASASEPLSVLDDPATEILSRVSPQDLSPDEAMARYAATGIWQLAPAPPAETPAGVMEDFFQTSLDAAIDFRDAVALPSIGDHFGDGPFLTPPSPPSAQTTFVLDARGYVLARPEGALTPDGVQVFAGRPAVIPPFATKPDTSPEQSITTDAENASDNAKLAALRPRVRPENAAEQMERSTLSGRTLSELGALRPQLRPASVQEAAAAEAAAEAAAAAQLQAEADAAATRAQAEAEAAKATEASTVDLAALEGAVAEAVAVPDPFAGATRQAVKASIKPNTRPRNFDKIVQRTLRNQEKQVQRQAKQQNRQDDFQEEGEEQIQVASAAAVTPKIPSAASVSKAATERKALKFERVNLIGVYGTVSDRRALVRMSNGRYQKVKVGDKLDGGKVRAIGDNELQYQKGGRSIVLKMPRG